jgi:hypothetical protein
MSLATRSRRKQLRVKRSGPLVAAALAAALGTSLTLGAGISGAAQAGPYKGGVLHFFSKQATFTYTTAAGTQLQSPPNTSGAGDVIQFTDFDYVGNHKHHAKDWTTTDHADCVFSSPTAATCYIQVSIGGSMVLVQGPISMENNQSFPVAGGTGIYQGLKGIVTDANTNASGSDSDITITLHR